MEMATLDNPYVGRGVIIGDNGYTLVVNKITEIEPPGTSQIRIRVGNRRHTLRWTGANALGDPEDEAYIKLVRGPYSYSG